MSQVNLDNLRNPVRVEILPAGNGLLDIDRDQQERFDKHLRQAGRGKDGSIADPPRRPEARETTRRANRDARDEIAAEPNDRPDQENEIPAARASDNGAQEVPDDTDQPNENQDSLSQDDGENEVDGAESNAAMAPGTVDPAVIAVAEPPGDQLPASGSPEKETLPQGTSLNSSAKSQQTHPADLPAENTTLEVPLPDTAEVAESANVPETPDEAQQPAAEPTSDRQDQPGTTASDIIPEDHNLGQHGPASEAGKAQPQADQDPDNGADSRQQSSDREKKSDGAPRDETLASVAEIATEKKTPRSQTDPTAASPDAANGKDMSTKALGQPANDLAVAPGTLQSDGAAAPSAPASNSQPQHVATRPEGQPPGTEPEAARFVQRVARAFQAIGSREGNIRLRLRPPELGSLRLELSVKNGAMTARLEAETSAARNALLDNLPALRDRLAQQDIKIDRFDVDLAQDQSGGPFRQSDENSRPWRRFSPTPPSSADSTGTDTETIARSAPSATSGDGTKLNVIV